MALQNDIRLFSIEDVEDIAQTIFATIGIQINFDVRQLAKDIAMAKLAKTYFSPQAYPEIIIDKSIQKVDNDNVENEVQEEEKDG